MAELVPLIEEVVSNGGTAELTVKGSSMMPMLHDGKDTITLSQKPEKLKKYDLPLYKRPITGNYVVHRVLAVKSKDEYIMCGDNQFFLEHGITYNDFVAVVCEFTRKGKTIKVTDFWYKVYCRVWYYSRPFRRMHSYLVKKFRKK